MSTAPPRGHPYRSYYQSTLESRAEARTQQKVVDDPLTNPDASPAQDGKPVVPEVVQDSVTSSTTKETRRQPATQSLRGSEMSKRGVSASTSKSPAVLGMPGQLNDQSADAEGSNGSQSLDHARSFTHPSPDLGPYHDLIQAPPVEQPTLNASALSSLFGFTKIIHETFGSNPHQTPVSKELQLQRTDPIPSPGVTDTPYPPSSQGVPDTANNPSPSTSSAPASDFSTHLEITHSEISVPSDLEPVATSATMATGAGQSVPIEGQGSTPMLIDGVSAPHASSSLNPCTKDLDSQRNPEAIATPATMTTGASQPIEGQGSTPMLIDGVSAPHASSLNSRPENLDSQSNSEAIATPATMTTGASQPVPIEGQGSTPMLIDGVSTPHASSLNPRTEDLGGQSMPQEPRRSTVPNSSSAQPSSQFEHSSSNGGTTPQTNEMDTDDANSAPFAPQNGERYNRQLLPNVSVCDDSVPGGVFWTSTLKMIDLIVSGAVARASCSSATDVTGLSTELGSKMKDAFVTALDEHHQATNRPDASRRVAKNVSLPKGKGKSKRSEPDSDADDEEDIGADGRMSDRDSDDDNELFNYSRQRKPYSNKSCRQRRKRSTWLNISHNLLRQYLAGHGFRQDAPPDPPSAAELAAFEKERKNGPSLRNCKYDWTRPFSSTWNSTLSHVLALDFLETIKDTPHDPSYDDPKALSKLIARKLRRVRKAYQDSLPPLDSSISLEQKKAAASARYFEQSKACRRDSRRHGTFVRRGTIIDKRLPENPELWKRVKEIHDALGQVGMSSDETETEGRGIVAKVVRRIPKVWLSEEIGQMWEAVEILGKPTIKASGNNQIQRIFAASTVRRNKPRAVRGLPRNFYSSLWWKGLTEAERYFLDADPQSKPIPSKDMFKTSLA